MIDRMDITSLLGICLQNMADKMGCNVYSIKCNNPRTVRSICKGTCTTYNLAFYRTTSEEDVGKARTKGGRIKHELLCAPVDTIRSCQAPLNRGKTTWENWKVDSGRSADRHGTKRHVKVTSVGSHMVATPEEVGGRLPSRLPLKS